MTKQNRKQTEPAAGHFPFPTPLPCNTRTFTQLLERLTNSQTLAAGRGPADNPGGQHLVPPSTCISCPAASSSHRGFWGPGLPG